MRVLIVELAHILLIVTAFNVRKEFDPLRSKGTEISQRLLQKLAAQLKEEMTEFSEDEYDINNMQKITVKPTVPQQSSGDITLRIFPNGIKYIFEQLVQTIRHDAMRHRPHTMRTSYHGMDINVDSIQIVEFLAPRLEAEHMGGSKFRFSTHGGGMRYLGLYSAVYKTTREGQFEAFLEGIRINLDVNFEEIDGKAKVTQEKCHVALEDVLVQLTPAMPTQILDLLQKRIQERFQEKVCPALLRFIEEITTTALTLASVEEIAQQTEPIGTPCVVQHEKEAWRFDAKGLKISFKRSNPREKRSIISNSVKESQASEFETASVSLTEEYVNEMLGDLVKNGNVFFHLHMIPDIEKALRTQCTQDDSCLGSLVNLGRVANGSGRLDSQVITPPYIEFRNRDSAILHITLHTVLSFQNRAAHHRIPYLRLELSMKLRIVELSFDQSSLDGYYRWAAKYEMIDLQINNLHTDFEEMKDVARRIHRLFGDNRARIEELLSTHLNGELPFRLNPHVYLQPKSAIFGHRRVTIPLNFTVDKRLFPAFQFLRSLFF